MTSSAYDPKKFEFVARMGRIPSRDDRKSEKIPVMFRIPDPPKQELVTIPLGRSMRAEPFGGIADYKPQDLDDFLVDLRPERESATDTESQTRDDQLSAMIRARRERENQRKLQQHAQQLVNEALLQTELKELKEREKMLHSIKSQLDQEQVGGRPDMRDATIFETPVNNDQLMKYITKELERLVPVIPERQDH